MPNSDAMNTQLEAARKATAGGPPQRTSNPFFGVGPITDMTQGPDDARAHRAAFEAWLEATYRKRSDTGRDLGPFTVAELNRSMHRGTPADEILRDMMAEIQRYFGFPKENKMAVGLGGGHSGFTVCVLHLMDANDPAQHVYIDTPAPESEAGKAGGFFRQSWGSQIVELQRCARNGDEARLHFAQTEGAIPGADELTNLGVKLFIGVGHETTGATCYTETDVRNLLEWIDRDPENHHAVIDVTSLLGAMPWSPQTVQDFMQKCCMFSPFQKAIGGVSGYFTAAFTPQALTSIERIQSSPSWAIPRQLKIVVPEDPKRPLTGPKTTSLGPFYDAVAGKMLGGIINTFSILAFAETTYGVKRAAELVGDVSQMNARSMENRDAINAWVAAHPLFDFGVADPERRGAAVTLLKITDPDITDADIHARILARSKQLLGYEGITHPDGTYEPGLDVARYVNAFPGTPGDYRAWIGGIRPLDDVIALLENLQYAYLRAKILVLEEALA